MRLPRICYQTYIRDLAASSITASTAATEGPADAPLRPDTAEYWEPTALPATWEADLGTIVDIDYVALAGHTLGSSGCAVLVETSDGSVSGSPEEELVWTTFASDVSPGDDAPLLFLDDTTSCRYVRLTITGGATMPRVASVYAGVALAVVVGASGGFTPPNLSRETVLHQSLSRGGQFLGQGFRRHGVNGSVTFRGLTPAWYRENFDPFVKEARQYPAFFAWSPEDYPTEIAYAWTERDIVPSYMGVDQFMEVTWNFHGIGNE